MSGNHSLFPLLLVVGCLQPNVHDLHVIFFASDLLLWEAFAPITVRSRVVRCLHDRMPIPQNEKKK